MCAEMFDPILMHPKIAPESNHLIAAYFHLFQCAKPEKGQNPNSNEYLVKAELTERIKRLYGKNDFVREYLHKITWLHRRLSRGENPFSKVEGED
jgi:hypothetical protein